MCEAIYMTLRIDRWIRVSNRRG